MSKDKELFEALLLDYLSAINKDKAISNLSKERLIYLTGQREAIINLLETVTKW
jgi:hypothetical protein